MRVAAEGRRVVVRAVREGDLAAIEAWYLEAAKAAYDSLSLKERWCRSGDAKGRLLAVLRQGENEPIGLLEYRVGEAAEGWLTIGFIALAKAYRGWGYGSEAVRLLEEHALGAGLAARFRAEVDVGNGLGFYFWLRLGYRPAEREEWHGEGTRDRMAMVRVAAR